MVEDRPIRVLLIAPALTAWGLAQLLRTEPARMVCVGVLSNIATAQHGAAALDPHVVVVDLDAEPNPDTLLSLHALVPARLLALTSSRMESVHDAAVLAGARGVVLKHDSPDEFFKAIEKVRSGELWIDRQATSRIFMELARQKQAAARDPERERLKTLTPREIQTVVAIASDAAAPGKVLARRLHITENTLRNHLTSIYAKLGVSNRMELYAFAHRHGMAWLRAVRRDVGRWLVTTIGYILQVQCRA